MSRGDSQQEPMVNFSPDLGGESWCNGPEEISDNWIMLSVLSPETELLRKKANTAPPGATKDKEGVQKDFETDNMNAKKRAKRYDARPDPEFETNMKDMAISWLKKAFGTTGFRDTVPGQGYHHPVRKNW